MTNKSPAEIFRLAIATGRYEGAQVGMCAALGQMRYEKSITDTEYTSARRAVGKFMYVGLLSMPTRYFLWRCLSDATGCTAAQAYKLCHAIYSDWYARHLILANWQAHI